MVPEKTLHTIWMEMFGTCLAVSLWLNYEYLDRWSLLYSLGAFAVSLALPSVVVAMTGAVRLRQDDRRTAIAQAARPSKHHVGR